MLPESLPKYSLGWGVLNWCSRWLAQPDGDYKGERWVFTNEQARFIVHFYAVDEYGLFLYRRGVLERPKGWGKSPLLAAICCAELLGPVKFSHFDEETGKPVGRPFPSSFVQIAAISEDQTDNTMSLVGEMLSGECEYRYNLDIGLSRVLAPGKRKLSRVTASPRSREGNRPTFVVMDETHLWVPAEKGPELSNVLRRNLAKTAGRSIETTNAPVPGEGSVAESSHDYYETILAGTSFDNTLLFDTREVVVGDIYDKAQAWPALIQVYGDSAHGARKWIDLDRIWAEINDPATKEPDARRFYFNQRVQDYSQWIKEPAWKDAENKKLKLKKNDKIALGFKAVTRNGAAALVACRVTDGALFLLGLWEKPANSNANWEVPIHDADSRVRRYLKKDNCYYLCADPWTVQDIVGRWDVDFEDKVEGFWISQKLKMTKAVDQFEEALYGGRVWHDGNADLKRHIMNTFTEETSEGYVLRKEFTHSKKYITAAQAAVLAYEAAQIAIENGCLDDPPPNDVYSF